jgi:hypothetical protein
MNIIIHTFIVTRYTLISRSLVKYFKKLVSCKTWVHLTLNLHSINSHKQIILHGICSTCKGRFNLIIEVFWVNHRAYRALIKAKAHSATHHKELCQSGLIAVKSKALISFIMLHSYNDETCPNVKGTPRDEKGTMLLKWRNFAFAN